MPQPKDIWRVANEDDTEQNWDRIRIIWEKELQNPEG
jgi:hypothetical protein